MTQADCSLGQIIVDLRLAPVGADTYWLVNMGLDAMEMIRADKDLDGVHSSVGLSNFAWGTLKEVRHQLERAYLALATQRGLDFALANPERAKQELVLDKMLKNLGRFEVLMIDDFGYVKQNREEMKELFTLLAHRYE